MSFFVRFLIMGLLCVYFHIKVGEFRCKFREPFSQLRREKEKRKEEKKENRKEKKRKRKCLLLCILLLEILSVSFNVMLALLRVKIFLLFVAGFGGGGGGGVFCCLCFVCGCWLLFAISELQCDACPLACENFLAHCGRI